jgi:DedD protein
LNVANQIQDDGFHEIQLNGKQLVFLFMAATVVSVVIFLCGVLVGRGVRAERAADSSVAANADPTPAPPPSTPAQPPAGSDPTAAPPPPPTSEDLTYFNRLEKPAPAQEQLKTPAAEHKAQAAEHKAPTAEHRAPAAPREAAATIGRSPVPPAVEKPAREPERSATTEPSAAPKEAPRDASKPAAAEPAPAGDGFAVQIAALNVRSEADAIAKRLSSKGYTAYVMSPANGTPSVYRVRVGKFPTRREAESIAARLQKEEQFKPWVTR